MSVEDTEVGGGNEMPAWVPRAIAMFFLGVAGFLFARWLLQELTGPLIILLVSLFLAFAIESAVNRLEAWG